jgi:hypothetical protein
VSPSWSTLPLSDRIAEAEKRYLKLLGRNNGIKEKDVLRILLPLGIHEADLSPTWLATMNSFGQARGKAAHSAKSVQTPPDPVAERQTVDQIVAELMTVDAKLTSLLRKRQSALVFDWMDRRSIDLAAARRRT